MLHVLHSTFYISCSMLHVLRSTFYILHSMFHVLHSTFYILCFMFYVARSTLHLARCTLYIMLCCVFYVIHYMSYIICYMLSIILYVYTLCDVAGLGVFCIYFHVKCSISSWYELHDFPACLPQIVVDIPWCNRNTYSCKRLYPSNFSPCIRSLCISLIGLFSN